jgi:hypothetical protein
MKRPAAIAPQRASPRTDTVTTKSPAARAAQMHFPHYSEDWTEDSGQGLALRSSRPITDPQSLEQVRTSNDGRGERGSSECGGSWLPLIAGPRPAGRG